MKVSRGGDRQQKGRLHRLAQGGAEEDVGPMAGGILQARIYRQDDDLVRLNLHNQTVLPYTVPPTAPLRVSIPDPPGVLAVDQVFAHPAIYQPPGGPVQPPQVLHRLPGILHPAPHGFSSSSSPTSSCV